MGNVRNALWESGARLDALASRMKHGTAFFFLVFHTIVVLDAARLGRFVILYLFFCHSLLSYSGDLMLNGADRIGSDYACFCISVTQPVFSNSEEQNASTAGAIINPDEAFSSGDLCLHQSQVPKYPIMDMSWARYRPLNTL